MFYDVDKPVTTKPDMENYRNIEAIDITNNSEDTNDDKAMTTILIKGLITIQRRQV